MKNLLILGLLGFCSLGTYGQDDSKTAQKHQLSAEQVAELQTKKMTLSLDLNASQQEQVMEINKQHAIERKAQREQRLAADQKLEKLSTDELVQKKSAALDKQIAHQRAMKNILNEQQYATWKKARAHKARVHKARILKKRRMQKRIKMHRKIQHRKMRK